MYTVKNKGLLKFLVSSWYYLNIMQEDERERERDVKSGLLCSGQFLLNFNFSGTCSWFWLPLHTNPVTHCTQHPQPNPPLRPALSRWPRTWFLIVGPFPDRGTHAWFSRQPVLPIQLFLPHPLQKRLGDTWKRSTDRIQPLNCLKRPWPNWHYIANSFNAALKKKKNQPTSFGKI